MTTREPSSGTRRAVIRETQRVKSDALRRRKDLGQFLTPEPIAALACAAAVDLGSTRVIDPSSGGGSMLAAALERGRLLGRLPRVCGIEIDPVMAERSRCLVHEMFPRIRTAEVRRADAFLEVAGVIRGSKGPYFGAFDAIVGNPPYVRHQSLGALLALAPKPVVSSFQQLTPHASAAKLMDTIIRTCLVARLLDPGDRTPARIGRAARELFQDSTRVADPTNATWVRLVASYSGLSDLALPMWLMTWLLAKPNGRVAYVTTGSLKNREYGRLLRYFMLRFLRPELVVEQEGNSWFPGAQVTTSLMVFVARDAREAAVPLSDRHETRATRVVRVARSSNLANPETLRAAAGIDGTLAESASCVIKAMRDGRESSHWNSREVSEREAAEELLAGSDPNIRRLEGLNDHRVFSVARDPTRSALVPGELRLALTGFIARPLATLADLGAVANQGLRTGANDFFYVEVLEDDPRSAFVTVRLGPALTSAATRLPRNIVHTAVRFQRELAWPVVDPRRCRYAALVTAMGAHPRDYATLIGYPKSWRRAWAAQGMFRLDRVSARLIDLGERAHHGPEERRTRIPELTAVKTNATAPRPTDGGIPRRPTWWYTLPIHPRHVGPIVIPRVNAGRMRAHLNPRRLLVDANFSTVTIAEDRVDALFALMNSTWVDTNIEYLATPMGGGALKVEAAHLGRVALPSLDATEWATLGEIGRRLCASPSESADLDSYVAKLVAGESALRVMSLVEQFAHSARSRRPRAISTADVRSDRKSDAVGA